MDFPPHPREAHTFHVIKLLSPQCSETLRFNNARPTFAHMTSLPSPPSSDILNAGGANIPPQSITGVSKPLTVRPGWFMMTCSVLVGLIGTALIGFAAFLVTVAIQRGTLTEIGAVSAAIAVFGLLLFGVAAGNARSRTIVSSAGLELHPFIGRVKTLSWQQSHDRIWLHTAHIYGSWAITVCKISVALDEKQVVLPGAVTQGLFRKRTQARAERIIEQIHAMDPLNR